MTPRDQLFQPQLAAAAAFGYAGTIVWEVWPYFGNDVGYDFGCALAPFFWRTLLSVYPSFGAPFFRRTLVSALFPSFHLTMRGQLTWEGDHSLATTWAATLGAILYPSSAPVCYFGSSLAITWATYFGAPMLLRESPFSHTTLPDRSPRCGRTCVPSVLNALHLQENIFEEVTGSSVRPYLGARRKALITFFSPDKKLQFLCKYILRPTHGF